MLSTSEDSSSTVEVAQYSRGIASVLWENSFSIVEIVQYIGGGGGGVTSVDAGDNISTVEG